MSIYLSAGICMYVCVLAFVFGTIFASFVTCQADRIVAHEPWWKGRSHCDVCGHVLGASDLVPIVSWLVHRGRCQYCHARLSARYVWIELLSGIVFVVYVLVHGTIDLILFRDLAFLCCLLGLSLVDLAIQEIPDGYLVFSLIVWALAGIGHLSYYFSLLAGFVIAGSLLLLSLIMDHILKKESMGGGDIKLFFVTGCYLGFGSGLFALILSCIAGLIFVVVWKREKIPFGPSIAIGTLAGLLVGPWVVQWYLGLFGM